MILYESSFECLEKSKDTARRFATAVLENYFIKLIVANVLLMPLLHSLVPWACKQDIAEKMMKTPDVRIDSKLNKEIWSQGIKLVFEVFVFENYYFNLI